MSGLVTIGRFHHTNPHVLELRSSLEAEGIVVIEQTHYSARGGGNTSIELLISSEQLEKAKPILQKSGYYKERSPEIFESVNNRLKQFSLLSGFSDNVRLLLVLLFAGMMFTLLILIFFHKQIV
ncbi:MAG TPA: hypothetical protein VL651_04745 [Bacteroidia bacterium]|jgi:hypothetical protein|nr:hypothetical protein [Bacteroidia bacterium]